MDRASWSDDDLGGLPSLVVAAHELKNPLALIRQLGLLIGDEGISATQRQYYQKQLIMSADRSLKLVTDLSMVANIQESLFTLEPVNPFAVCQEIARETSPFARLYNRQIIWPKAKKNILVVANTQLLERVLSNFVSNALRYTEPDVPISVNIRQSSDVARISVRDYGPRLSKKEYNRMLDQLDSLKTARTRPDSSGLGVFLASRFAHAMQGKIGLTRHRDGVTFYVDMPLSRQMSWL